MSTIPVDYTSRDFDSYKAALLAYAATAFPDWVPGSEGDFGVLLVELLSYVGDVNSYYIDRAQNEAYLATATQLSSVLNIAQLLGYTPGTGTPATGTVTFVASSLINTSGAPAISIPAGTQLATAYVPSIDGQIIFETQATVSLTPGSTVSVGVIEGTTQVDPNTGGPIALNNSTGLPDQNYMIPKPRVYVDTVEVFVGGTDSTSEWRSVTHLLDADSTDQVFSTYNDASGYTWIQFGDGLNGAIPGVGLTIYVTYRTGYGSLGNLTAGAITSVVSTSPSGIALQKSTSTSGLSTSTATSGGADPDTIDQIRNNAPKTFFTQKRAVTQDDFENLALAVPGVAKANAVADYFSSVTVYVLGPDGNPANATLLDSVFNAISPQALIGVSVNTAAPTGVAVNLGATGGSEIAITVWDQYNRLAVQNQVQTALAALLSFTNIDLGMRLTVSDVYAAIMAVPGVRYVSIPLMARADAAQSGTADIQFQPFEYPTAGNIVLTSTGGIG